MDRVALSERIAAYLKYTVAQIVMQIMKIFWLFPLDDKKILFLSFDGNQYSDSPKYLCEYIYSHKGSAYEYTWALNASGMDTKVIPEWVKVINRKSISFHICYARSKYIITNNSLYVYYPKRKHQVILNTWHGGSPLKTCGLDDEKATFYSKLFFKLQDRKYTAYLSSSRFMTESVFRGSLAYSGEILEFGMPRNAILFQNHDSVRDKVYKYYGIEPNEDVGIILYAPTFRGNSRGASFLPATMMLNISRCTELFSQKYHKKFVFMFRAHYTMANKINNENCIIATYYPDMQELLCAADILITDYSSCMGDMALMNKPVFLYAPDIAEYTKDRGFYWSIYELPFPIIESNEEFELVLNTFDYDVYSKGIREYLDKLGSFETESSTELAYNWLVEKHRL